MSSVLPWSNASNGNDGFYSGVLAHTDYELSPWWRVDLLSPYCVTSVYFMNRGDATTEECEFITLSST